MIKMFAKFWQIKSKFNGNDWNHGKIWIKMEEIDQNFMKTMPIWLKFNENWTNLTEIPWKWLKFQSNQANLDIDISGNWEEIDRNLATRPYSVAHSTQSGIGRQTDSRIDSHLTFEPVKLLTKWIQSKRSHQHGNANWCLFMLIYAHLC